jgi:toxin-antitoxin system PIN domain toxin
LSRFLLDLNTLLALLDPLHVFHDAAHRWVEATPNLRFLTCPLVQNGVIRIASQSAYPNALGSTVEVHAVLGDFCADPRHEFCPDDISLLDSSHLLRPALLTPSRVTDLYLLALARRHEARLATFDRRIPAEAVPDGPRHLTLIEA